MNIKVNNHKIVIMTFIIVISISCPSVAFAESDFGNIVNEVTMEDDSNISKAIGKGTVLATRESPTKIKYTFNTTFTPTADSVTMKVWRLCMVN